jgi:hypothetical protein
MLTSSTNFMKSETPRTLEARGALELRRPAYAAGTIDTTRRSPRVREYLTVPSISANSV